MSRICDAIGPNRAQFFENDLELKYLIEWMEEKTDCSVDDLAGYLVKIDMGKVQKCWYSPEFVAKNDLEYEIARSRLMDLADNYVDFLTDQLSVY